MADAMTPGAYRRQLYQLLPPGVVWPEADDSMLQRLLLGHAQEYARVDSRAVALRDEADPRQALYLFEEWERSYGLPSRCAPADQSLADRRAALIGRIVGRGGLRPQDMIELAEGLGYEGVQVLEPRQATVEVIGAAGYQGAVIGDAVYGEEWAHVWQVLIPGSVIRESLIDQSEIGDPLRSWGDVLVECALREAAPSWLLLHIGYLEE